MESTGKQNISSVQLFILLFTVRISSLIMYPAFFAEPSELISALIINIIIGFVLLSFVSGFRKFLLKTDFRITDSPVASAVLIISSVYFAIMYIVRAYMFCRSVSSDDTSEIILVLPIFIAALYGSIKGIEAIARFSSIDFSLIIIGLIITSFALFPSFKAEELMPAGEYPKESSLDLITIIFSESTHWILLLFFSGQSVNKFRRTSFIWLSFESIALVFMLILICGSVGDYITGLNYPFFRIIDGVGSFQRLKPLFIALAIVSFVCLYSSFLIIIKNSIDQQREKNKINKALFPVTVLLIAVSFFIIKDNNALIQSFFNKYIMSAVIIINAVIIPSVVIIFRSIKRKPVILNKTIKTASLVLAAIISVNSFAGCSSPQLNQRLIVQGIGIDKSDSGFMMTLITLDTEAEKSEKTLKTECFQGKDIAAAIKNSEYITGKKIMLSQCLFILLNQEAAAYTSDIMDYFAKNREIIKTVNIMASESKARETIITATKKLNYHSEDINVISGSNASDQPVPHFTLFDYRTGKNKGNTDIFLPLIKLDKEINKLTSTGGIVVKLKKKEVFKLTQQETSAILLMQNKTNLILSESASAKEAYAELDTETVNGKLCIKAAVTLPVGICPAEENKIKNLIYESLKKTIHDHKSDLIGISEKQNEVKNRKPDDSEWEKMLLNSKITMQVKTASDNQK